jgi:DNA-binding transcriptional MerR regulator
VYAITVQRDFSAGYADDVVDDVGSVSGLSIGSAAAHLGVAPETLRSWGRRYGLVPSTRTDGGHRRYSADDLGRLVRMQRLVAEGMAPSRAAQTVLTQPDDDPAATAEAIERRQSAPAQRRRPGGPGGRVLAMPGAAPETRGLARAAVRLDAEAVGGIVRDLVAQRGVIAAWELIRPVLSAVADRWESTGEGVEIEHMLSEVITDAMRSHRAGQRHAVPGRPVLLASCPDDLHVLPVHVLAASLAEQRVPLRLFGASLPVAALNAAIRRLGSSALFVWCHMSTAGSLRGLELPRSRPPIRLLVGGPGWDTRPLPPGARRAATLAEATSILRATVR